MMACVSRGLYISKINIWFIKVDVRGFARNHHRNPVKIFSSEEAKNLSRKPSLVFEDSTTDVPPNKREQVRSKNVAVEYPSKPIAKYDKKENAYLNEKNSRSILKSQLHVVDVKQKQDTDKNLKDKITVQTLYGDKIKQEIISDKLAERKLR